MTRPEEFTRVVHVVMEDGRHRYWSPACVHGEHDDCRLACKTCDVPCLCYCHLDDSDVTKAARAALVGVE